ncbi:hypothetical protein ACFXPI_19975 [Streptomyces sp. NPDC059104]|uniref:hypothetical protein n=1 Tax=Streptomyces sp. NPDC059104 TaxID=3346729 RepID=UPI00368F9362
MTSQQRVVVIVGGLPGAPAARPGGAARRVTGVEPADGHPLVGGVLAGGLCAVGALARGREGEASPDDPFHLLTDDGGH